MIRPTDKILKIVEGLSWEDSDDQKSRSIINLLCLMAVEIDSLRAELDELKGAGK